MTADQRFTLLMTLLSATLLAVGFVVRLAMKLNNESIVRDTQTAEHIESLRRHDKANQEQVVVLTKRQMDNTEKLTELYSKMSEDIATIQGRLMHWDGNDRRR